MLLTFLLPLSLLFLGTFASPVGTLHLPHVSSGHSSPQRNNSASLNSSTHLPSRACGTGPPSDSLVAAHIRHALSYATSPSNPHYMASLSPLLRRRAQLAAAPVQPQIVNTYFHVVTTTDQARLVTPAMVTNQLGALQQAYAPSGISFRLVNTSFTTNDSWATDADDATMKQVLRRGSYSALNIYFQSNLSTAPTTPGGGSQLLGYCTLPTNITYLPCPTCARKSFPPSAYVGDGCNVLAGSMPGGPVVGYNLGRTAVHEVGHWFGLLHTFQGNSCNDDDGLGGDMVSDTNVESESTDGCPVSKDSCPGGGQGAQRLGGDMVWNYMDYSSDKW